MIYLATMSGDSVRDAIRRGDLGHLNQPASANRVLPGSTWAADNGCFNAASFTFDRWLAWLDNQPRTAMWAAVPDVVGDHDATITRWAEWAPVVADLGFPPAFVAQDGCSPATVPVDAAAVFIGGSTEWKLGADAKAIVDAARGRVPVHMGRVNTFRRVQVAAAWGCDTVDGTLLAFGPDQNLPKLLRWMRWVNTQPTIFDSCWVRKDGAHVCWRGATP